MDKHLTTKATPGKMLVLLEIIGVLVTGLATFMWFTVGLYGLVTDGLVLAHLFLLLFALPWAVGLILLLRRLYDRSRARRIVSLLCASEQGVMTCSQLSRVGIYSPDKTVAKLFARQYLRNVGEAHGEIRLLTGEQKQSLCPYCGAPLNGEAADKCPGCGARTAKP